MNKISFTTIILKPDGVGTWHYADIPLNVEKEFGKKGRVPVKATLNGHSFTGSLMPHGNGGHFLVIGKEIRDKAGVQVGDTVELTVELDSAPRIIETPEDMAAALKDSPEAEEFYNQLAYSHKKEYVVWVNDAKREETRQNRITKAIKKLAKAEKLKT